MRLFAKSIIISAVTIMTLFSVFVITYDRDGHCIEKGDDIEENYEEEHEGKVYGIITHIPQERMGTWIVNRKKILVTTRTRIKEKHGKAETGAYVEVEGDYEGNDFRAYSIKVKKGRR